MKQTPKISTIHSKMDLIDQVLDFQLNAESFTNNKKVIDKIGNVIDKVIKMSRGHALISITRNNRRKLVLILTTDQDYYKDSYKIVTWKLKEAIEKAVDLEIHEIKADSALIKAADELSYRDDIAELASASIVETLNGFSSNEKALNSFNKFKSINEGSTDLMSNINTWTKTKEIHSLDIGRNVLKHIKETKNTARVALENLANKYKGTPLEIARDDSNVKDKYFVCGKISEVREIAGKRFFKIDWVKYFRSPDMPSQKGSCIGITSAGTQGNDMEAHQIGNSYIFTNSMPRWQDDNHVFDIENLRRIPYNLVDKGREFVALKLKPYTWKTILSPDPRVEENYIDMFTKDLFLFAKNATLKEAKMEGTKISVPEIDNLYYSEFEDNIKSQNKNVKGLQLHLKTIKAMVEEYNYVIKKNKAKGKDVTVTENIKYNHDKGKISYNDFSIAIDDEKIKARMYETFNEYLVKFYRQEATEQEILDNIVDRIFYSLERRVKGKTKQSYEIPIRINDTIDVKLEGKVKQDKDGIFVTYLYLNNKRFNKNEILTVLREMTCYRSQNEADAFINNIGRLSLSVYIGISTGYEVDFTPKEQEEAKKVKRVFKFKKLKGRSNYSLLLDGSEVPIKGKKLITLLYSNFIGEDPPSFLNKIPKIIFESSGSASEYLKYKVLIDSSYKAFKEKSREFLVKKINDMGAHEVTYYNKKARKNFDGILVDGSSGNRYVIAYDGKDSYVFLDPTHNEEKNQYEEGKYICMVDQSNIKSNISYDTVIAKLMALKNDSSIAHTIYNLEEEL